MRYTGTLLLLALACAAPAQTSVFTDLLEPYAYDPERGPFYINDSTVVYLGRDGLFALSTEPDASPVSVPTELGSLYSMAQAPNGDVYVATGSDCDVIIGPNRLYRLRGTTATSVVAERVSTYAPSASLVAGWPYVWDVSADGTLWLAVEDRIIAYDLATGRERVYRPFNNRPGQRLEPRTALVALDSTLAAVFNYGEQYDHWLVGSRTQQLALPARHVEVLRTDSGLLAMGRHNYSITSALYRFDQTGAFKDSVAAPALASSWLHNHEIVADTLVLLQAYGRLYRWNPTSDEFTAEPYYDLGELHTWQIDAARLNARGDLALAAQQYSDDLAWIPEAIPLNPYFVQVIPAGADPTLVAPGVDLEVKFEVSDVDGEPALTYTILATNNSDTAIDNALIAGKFRFGLPCREFVNGGYTGPIAPGETDTVDQAVPYYARYDGSITRPRMFVDDRFANYQSNGRPTLGGRGSSHQFIVNSLREIVDAPDVRLLPTLAAASLRVVYERPRAQLLVVDAVGRVAFRQNLSRDAREIPVDVSGLSSGPYYLLLRGDEGTSVHPFQVAR